MAAVMLLYVYGIDYQPPNKLVKWQAIAEENGTGHVESVAGQTIVPVNNESVQQTNTRIEDDAKAAMLAEGITVTSIQTIGGRTS